MAESKPTSDELECYIHCISPIKNAGNPLNKRKYFDFKVQTNNEVLRGVCFSPEKRQKLEQVKNTKSPVKLKNFSHNNKFGPTNIVVERNTQIITSPSPSFPVADLNTDVAIEDTMGLTSCEIHVKVIFQNL